MRLVRLSRYSESDMKLVRERAEDENREDDTRGARGHRVGPGAGTQGYPRSMTITSGTVLAHSEAIELRQTGFAASMIAAHARATGRELERHRRAEANRNSQSVGEVGALIEIDATMVSTKVLRQRRRRDGTDPVRGRRRQPDQVVGFGPRRPGARHRRPVRRARHGQAHNEVK